MFQHGASLVTNKCWIYNDRITTLLVWYLNYRWSKIFRHCVDIWETVHKPLAVNGREVSWWTWIHRNRLWKQLVISGYGDVGEINNSSPTAHDVYFPCGLWYWHILTKFALLARNDIPSNLICAFMKMHVKISSEKWRPFWSKRDEWRWYLSYSNANANNEVEV